MSCNFVADSKADRGIISLVLDGSGSVWYDDASLIALPPIGNLDYPSNGQKYKCGELNMNGWVLDGIGVSKVEILIDGNVVGTAEYGDPRSDIAEAHPEYDTFNIGYRYILDTTELTNGDHTISIRETNNSNVQINLSENTINISNNQPIGPVVKYTTHVQDIGWQDYVADDAMSGHQGNQKD